MVDHFTAPRLAAETVESDGGGGVWLRAGGRSLRLDIGGSATTAVAVLSGLCDPSSSTWTEVGHGDSGLVELIRELDGLGWIVESNASCREVLTTRADALAAVVDQAAGWLRLAVGTVPTPEALLTTTDGVRDTLDMIAVARRRGFVPAPIAGGATRDLAAYCLDRCLSSWARTSPLTLEVLRAALDDLRDVSHLPRPRRWESTSFAMSSVRCVRNNVWTALGLMAMASTGTWRRQGHSVVPIEDIGGPGINVLVRAEHAAEWLLEALGESPVFEEIRGLAGPTRVAQAIYAHQYFVTVRYVETLYSFLRMTLDDELKLVGTRYLSEEQGHEAHELATCLEVGLTHNDVALLAPVPLFAAYPELLIELAEGDALAFCLAITVAEGLPGAGKPLPQALHRAGLDADHLEDHTEIDVRLDHGYFTRRLLSKVGWVPAEVASRAIERSLLVTEVSQLAWHQLASYAASSSLAMPPVAFGLAPEELWDLWATCPGGS